MVVFDPTDLSRFEPFTVLETSYKKVDDHEIMLNVLIPKILTDKNNKSGHGQPIVIRFHGGALVAGGSMFPQFWGPWLLELAQREGAVIVSPNYRLLPEANANDQMEDLEDSWRWIQSSLAAYVEQETKGTVKVDLNRIMTAGESAGGYFSLQLGLNHPGEIRAVTAQYPMIDMKGPHFWEYGEKFLLGTPIIPVTVFEEHIAKVKADEAALGRNKKIVVSDDRNVLRVPLGFTMVQHGLYRHYFDKDDKNLFPLERIEAGQKFPKGGVFVWHGTEDTVVPVVGSEKLEVTVRQADPEANFRLTKRPGEHGFDAETKLDEQWIAEGFWPLLQAWLE